jgi:hypothetical protein
LVSLLQEQVFSGIRSTPLQRTIYESCFAELQAVRGLILTAAEVHKLSNAVAAGAPNPAREQASANMNVLLKKAAEHIRLLAGGLKQNPTAQTAPALEDSEVMTLVNRGAALMLNARDKYVSRAQASHIAGDEKQFLEMLQGQVREFW